MGHLQEDQRLTIATSLEKGMKVSMIARMLKVPGSTVQREIDRHAEEVEDNPRGKVQNRCIHRHTCTLRYVCGSCTLSPTSNRFCRSCRLCNEKCPQFSELTCERLAKAPHVCNGCPERGKCVLRKRIYVAGHAQKAYERNLSESRRGAAVTEEERRCMGEILAAGFRKGQSVYHIVHAQSDQFNRCPRTVYDYVNKSILPNAGRWQLPIAPKLRPRRKKGTIHKVDQKCRLGRSYEEFSLIRDEHPAMNFVEMDSVEGRRGGNVLLTLQFNSCGLMLAFARERNTSQSVIDIFDRLEKLWGTEIFRQLFPVILTDNGTEFSNPGRLETSPVTGERRTRIFYCHPYSSSEKPHVENNHRNLRAIFPKGKDIPLVDGEVMGRALSHLNSKLRESFGDVPAIVKFEQLHGKGILEKLHIGLVPAMEVTLTPEVLHP